jgi:hypothetical protein
MKSAFDSNTETGFTVLQPTNPFPVLTENVLTANQAFPVDLNTGDFISTSVNAFNSSTLTVDSLGILKCVTDGTVSSQGFGTVAVTTPNGYYSASVLVKGTAGQQISLVLRDSITAAPAWGSATTVTLTGDWQVAKINGLNCISGKASIAIATSGTLATTFYVKQLKINQGPTATEWSAGRKKKVTLNYLGKVAGSVVENPHRAMARTNGSFSAPTTPDDSNINFTSLSIQDGVLASWSTSLNGSYAQQLFEFDLSNLGMSLSELKKAIRSLSLSWVGYAVGSNATVQTYGATVKVWNNTSSTWNTFGAGNTTSTPSTATATQSNPDFLVDKNQKVYILIHSTYPADSTISSQLFTDYVKLDVTLSDAVDYTKSNIIKIQPETKTIRTWFPAISRRYVSAPSNGAEDQIAFYSRYVPYQGIGALSGLKTITESGKGFVTTYGTGKPKPTAISNATYPFPIVSLLPQTPSYKDSDFVNDGLLNSTASNVYDIISFNLISDEMNASSATYRKLKYGDTFNTAMQNPASRGSLFISAGAPHDVLLKYIGQGTDINKKVLYGVYFLAICNGELMLVVATSTVSQIVLDGTTSRAVDIFKLPGRPLVKGV